MRKFLTDVKANPDIHRLMKNNPNSGFDVWDGLESSTVLRRDKRTFEAGIAMMDSNVPNPKARLEELGECATALQARTGPNGGRLVDDDAIRKIGRLTPSTHVAAYNIYGVSTSPRYLPELDVNFTQNVHALTTSPLYQNPENLSAWMQKIANEINDNPGKFSQVTFAKDRLALSRQTHLENPLQEFIGDVALVPALSDGFARTSYQRKFVTGGSNAFSSNLEKATRQFFRTEITSPSTERIASIKIGNRESSLFNANRETVRSEIQALYNDLPDGIPSQSQRLVKSEMQELEVINVETGSQVYNFTVNTSGQVVDL